MKRTKKKNNKKNKQKIVTNKKIKPKIMSNRKIQQNNKIQCYVHPDADLIDDYVTGSIVCPLCGLVVVDRVIDLFIDSRDYSHEDQRLIRSCVGSPENYLLHSYSNLSTHIKPRRDDQLTHKEISEGLFINLNYINMRKKNQKIIITKNQKQKKNSTLFRFKAEIC